MYPRHVNKEISIQNYNQIYGPVTFFSIRLRMQISFLNDVDIQLFLDFKIFGEKIIQYFLKLFKVFFLGHPVYMYV